MHSLIRLSTDKISTKKGMWITLSVWLIAIIILSVLAPSSKEYSVNNVSQLYPETSPSVIAQQKIDTYFKDDDGFPAILVIEGKDGSLNTNQLASLSEELSGEEFSYVKSMIPFFQLPEPVKKTFISEDETAAFLPILFEDNITSKEINVGLNEMDKILHEYPELETHFTGPAGIAVDASDLFSRADLVLLFSTVGIILILLIFTYRSPLLALIPLLAAGFVYAVVDRILGILGLNGVELASQSLSIMMVLLFAVVIDYSLFIFSRFREELKHRDNKYDAMKFAMREIGIPIFYSSATIFLTMIILFVANFGDYRNFAPVFSVAVLIVMFAALSLVPALFTLFGRRAFWPKIPKVGEEKQQTSGLWTKVGKFVSNKPIVSVLAVILFLLVSSSQIFGIQYEYNTLNSFPDDMPSRIGYEILEDKFSKGTLAETTIIFESESTVSEGEQEKLRLAFEEMDLVDSVRLSDQLDDQQVLQYSLTFSADPYGEDAMNILEDMMYKDNEFLAKAGVQGELYFAGETAASVDNRNVNSRDLILIVLAETLLIFGMLIFLTRSVKISGLMIGTILFSFAAALGLGTLLSGWIFDVHAISNRVPVYAFVFLVALGIDYNIFLVSRYLEEKKRVPVKQAVESAVAHTGGVISSAGIILAATFAVLMTQPVEVLRIFGFIVAIGILMDTFLVRGILLPGLLVLLEKNEHLRILKRKKNK